MAAAEIELAVLGGGRLAQSLCSLLGQNHATRLRVWARKDGEAQAVAALVPGARACASAGDAVKGAHAVFVAVPAPAIQEVAALMGPAASGNQVVIHAARGVGNGMILPHLAIRAETCVRKVGALGGPLHLDDLKAGQPIMAVVASRYDEVAELASMLTQGTPIRLHPTRDVVGVEVAGAISNVAALAAGMADQLALGQTARGVLLTRGLMEAARLGVRLGAERATFGGLAGVGDLIPRSVASTQRHRDVGAAVARGERLAEVLVGLPGCVEGVTTAREVGAMAARMGLKLPLLSAVDDVLAGRRRALDALEEILRMDIDLEREGLMAAS